MRLWCGTCQCSICPRAAWYFLACMCPVLFIHSADGHFDCFHLLPIVTDVTINTGMQVFTWAYISYSLGHVRRSGIARSYGDSMFNFLRSCQNVFQSSCTTLYFHHPCRSAQFLCILVPILIFWVFLNRASLVGVKWDLAVILNCASPVTDDVERLMYLRPFVPFNSYSLWLFLLTHV